MHAPPFKKLCCPSLLSCHTINTRFSSRLYVGIGAEKNFIGPRFTISPSKLSRLVSCAIVLFVLLLWDQTGLGVHQSGALYPWPQPAEATTVHYHGTVYRGIEVGQIREGGLTFQISVSIPAFPTELESMRHIMVHILSDHVQLVDESGYRMWEVTQMEEGVLIDNEEHQSEEEALTQREWKKAVIGIIENSVIEVSPDRQTVWVQFAPVNWTLSSSVALLIVPCLPFALFEQLEAVGIPDLPHNCLSGDSFVIRRIPFPKVKEVEFGFLVTGKPIDVPIAIDPEEPSDRFAMERSFRVVEGRTCLHTRNAFVRGTVWNAQLETFHFTPYRGGVHSLCFAPYPKSVPLLQLKLTNSFEIAGPEGATTDPPQVRAEVEFTGTIFGTNFSISDTAVMTEDLCSDFTAQNVYFVELQYISCSRMIFFGTFHKRGIYHVCYHRDGSPTYIRVSTLLVEKGSEVVIDSDTANVLIDQDVKLLTSASVKKLKVQNRGNLVLKQRSLSVNTFFLWSGGSITGHGLINISGYGRITTEGYETRSLLVPLHNYGEITVDVQRLSLERDGCIHNYGNLTLTVPSMGNEGISSIFSSTEHNAIYNYPGGIIRIIALQEKSYALLTNRFIFVGGTVMLSGKITIKDVSNDIESKIIIKSNSVVTFSYTNVGGSVTIEKDAILFAMGGCVFLGCTLSGFGKLYVYGDGVVLDSVTATESITTILGNSLQPTGNIITIGVYNTNYFGPQTVVLIDDVNFITGTGRSMIVLDGTTIVHLNGISFSGMVDVEIGHQAVVYQTSKGTQALSKYIPMLEVKADAHMYLIDFRAKDAVKHVKLEEPWCNQIVGAFGHFNLKGKVFLQGCIHASVTASIGGVLKTLREDTEEWTNLEQEFCNAPFSYLIESLCGRLTEVLPGYSGLLNRGEATIGGAAQVELEEITCLRGSVSLPEPVTIIARRQILVSKCRLSIAKGGLIRTPLLVNRGLVDVFDPLRTEFGGTVKVKRECFIRLRGVAPPCERFFKSKGVVQEVDGDAIFHCVDLKSDSNYLRTVLTNLPSDIPCPLGYIDYMREKWVFFSHIRSWPNFRPLESSMPPKAIFRWVSFATVGSLFVFRILLHVFGLTVHDWKEDMLKPSPLQLTLTWNEFKTKPQNYVALAFYFMNVAQQFFTPFHPFLPVPFPHVTIVCLRSTYLVMPFHTVEPQSVPHLSYFVLVWCGAVWIVHILGRYAKTRPRLNRVLNKARIFSALISIAMTFFFVSLASKIADGMACTTILQREPACSLFQNNEIHFPAECAAYFLIFVNVAFTSAGPHLGKIDHDLRAKATFIITMNAVHCLQVALWKILYYNPVVHVTVSMFFSLFHLVLTVYVPPTPYVNINRVVLISVVLRIPVFCCIYMHQLQLRLGWLRRCNQGTILFFGVIALSVALFIISICVYVFYVNLPDGSVGDPTIDALRRSIDQIRARIDDIKKAIPTMTDPMETENALNAVSRLRVELLEKQERYILEVSRLLHPFYFVHTFDNLKTDDVKPVRNDSLDLVFSLSSGNYLSQEEMETFSCGPALGKGSYGTVYLGILSTGKLVAVKYINVSTAKDDELQKVKGEVGFLMDLSHPNIIRYYGAHSMDNMMMIFMEFAVGGSLTSILRKFAVLTEAVMQLYTYQILSGLQYLHHKGVVHRDIKGENILIDGDGVSKLADFGCSKALADLANASQAGCGTLVGSPFYMAPEVIRSEVYGTKADIWSVGCTVVEMLNGGEPPWKSAFDNAYSAMFFVGSTKEIPSIPEDTSEACRNFLYRCFERDVAKRATAEELLQHEWLANVPSRALPLDYRTFSTMSFEDSQGDLLRNRRIRTPSSVLSSSTIGN